MPIGPDVNDLDPDALARRLACDQHGTLSRAQARSCGLSAQQIRYRTGLGRWRVLASGALLLGDCESEHSEIAGACVALGGIASHRTAGHLWGICDQPHDLVELTVARSRYRRSDTIEVYSTTQFELADVTLINSIPTTGLARTTLDLAAVLPERDLANVLRDVLMTGAITVAELGNALNLHSRPGRPGLGKFRRALTQIHD